MPQLLLAVLVGLVVSQVAMFATTLYLHRGLSHKAVTFSPVASWCFRFVLWITTGIVARQWASVHRKHHAMTDVEGDPHSPVLLGFWRVQLTNAALYRRVARDPDTVPRYGRDLKTDAWDRLFDRGWLGLVVGIGMLVVLLGPAYAAVAALVHVVYYLSANAAVNSVGHSFGSRPYGGSATNNQWLAWFTGGEGLHNNHHAAPTSAKLALHRGELDPGWWVIAGARRLGLAKVRLERVVLKPAHRSDRAA